jgi:hypothetical protein
MDGEMKGPRNVKDRQVQERNATSTVTTVVKEFRAALYIALSMKCTLIDILFVAHAGPPGRERPREQPFGDLSYNANENVHLAKYLAPESELANISSS